MTIRNRTRRTLGSAIVVGMAQPRTRSGKQVNTLLSNDAAVALAEFSASRNERPTVTVRRIVLDALLRSGHLTADPEPSRKPAS